MLLLIKTTSYNFMYLYNVYLWYEVISIFFSLLYSLVLHLLQMSISRSLGHFSEGGHGTRRHEPYCIHNQPIIIIIILSSRSKVIIIVC